MIKLFARLLLITCLSSCSSIIPTAQGNKVLVSPNNPPPGCKFLGQVTGNQGNFFTGDFTSNQNLEEGSMNDLRNKAAELGANYVQLLSNRAGITGSQHGEGGYFSGHSSQTNVTNLGNAYHCAESAINW